MPAGRDNLVILFNEFVVYTKLLVSNRVYILTRTTALRFGIFLKISEIVPMGQLLVMNHPGNFSEQRILRFGSLKNINSWYLNLNTLFELGLIFVGIVAYFHSGE